MNFLQSFILVNAERSYMILFVKFCRLIKLLLLNPSLFIFKFKRKLIVRRIGQIENGLARIHVGDVTFSYDSKSMPEVANFLEVDTEWVFSKFLKPGDCVIDVGANVGAISALALSYVGSRGKVISFEPVPYYFEFLKLLRDNNKAYDLIVNQCALGEKNYRSNIDISGIGNVGWNTMVPNFMLPEDVKETIEVEVKSLDEYLLQENLYNIDFIKVDTEGYEFKVLKGLQKYFKSNCKKPIIFCEIAPKAYDRLVCSINDFDQYMKTFGYVSYLLPYFSCVDLSELKETSNVVFVPK